MPRQDHMSRRWYCGYTHSHLEFHAKQQLERQGFETLLPTELADRSWEELPLFPRYIFIAFDMTADPWHKIKSTWGIQRLLMHGPESPTYIHDKVIDALRMQLEIDRQEQELERSNLPIDFHDGMIVKFKKRGAFQEVDLTGICKWVKTKKLGILAHLMGREVLLVVRKSEVRPAL
jgi:transcription antitermination factor NusG